MTLDPLLSAWIAELASASPTPGGGGASALAGALAAALAEMVGQLTVGRAKFRDTEPAVREALSTLLGCRENLLRLVNEDAEAYSQVSAAYGLPRASEDERALRDGAIQAALAVAIQPPRAVAAASLIVLRCADTLAEIGNPTVASDAGCAAILARAAVQCAGLNVLANAVLMRDVGRTAAAQREQAEREREADRLAQHALDTVRLRMGA